ncbi:MAG: hypothetical protein KDC38_00935 [Planctomycetes bacterium]|nr:hypothetical protein [Planctomycetota bacterium]
MSRSVPSALILCAVLIGLTASAPPSAFAAEFANFETPQLKPITTATVRLGDARLDVVLVCNTPDNSVEIYESSPPHAFIQRVPVGMGPATVRWLPATGRFYTCNFDGDSVSMVRLDAVPTPTGLTVFGALERTAFVGDQPADIAFDPANNNAFVTLSGRSSGVIVDLSTLALTSGEIVLEGDDPAIAPQKLAVKAPRQIAFLPDGRFFILNFMGESPDPNTAFPTQYDLDLWFLDNTNPTPIGQVKGLGSTNHAFAMTRDGTRMVVVGTKARNHDASGEVAVSQLQFGFVESRFWVLDTPLGGQPTVRPEAPAGAIPLPPFTPLGRNLNRDYTTVANQAVPASDALSQPTDVVILENDAGDITGIVVTAFHSDKVAIFRPASVPGGYAETQISLPVLNPLQGYTTSGPRGLAYDARRNLLFVACRLDNTMRVIDLSTNSVTAAFQLGNDPTPMEIRGGRVFLYNATATSGSGFVSCGSCHIDGATDALNWDLGVVASGPAIPPGLLGAGSPGLFTEFPSEKGPLITQTLQGLVNYRVNAEGQYLLTNAPYHWRADRPNFQAFNVAFVGLLGRSTSLTDPEMNAYTTFINTVRHPANPEQALDRVVPGFLDPSNPDDPNLASGTKLGEQIYHNHPTDGSLGCVGCHSLPEGSDNTLTDAFFVARTLTSTLPDPQLQPFETAALRNLVPREMWLHRAESLDPPIWVVANVGLTHDGNFAQGSINFFNNFFFAGTVPGGTQTNLKALTRYTREFDWSTAPAAGLSYTVDPALPGANNAAFSFFENQVDEANVGLAVIARQSTNYTGYWYDLTVSPPMYRQEGTTTLLTRNQILSLASGVDSAVIAQATPLGNERRVANPAGIATPIADVANPPANITSMPMAPMTYCTDIPLFVNNLNVDQSTVPPTVTLNPINTLWALRTFQLSVLGSFGVNSLHHEPPRRMRVIGDNIRPGAKLLVGIPTTTPGSFPVQILEMDLFPTKYFTDLEEQIWETEEELDPMVQFALLNGGPFAPDVVNTAWRLTTTPNLQPATWNRFVFAVLNEDNTINATFPFAPLTVQNTR